MRIVQDVPAGTLPREVAYIVKKAIEGSALGYYESGAFKRWNLPPLYQSGVRFAFEPGHGSGVEDFAAPITVYRRKVGDCNQLIVWRLCELYACGVPATCMCEWVGNAYHVKVRFPDGTLEDPALNLGAPHP